MVWVFVCALNLYHQKRMLVFFLLLGNVLSLAGASDDWCYKGCENTPSHWGDHFVHCHGDRQSPINIDTKQVIGNKDLKEFNLVNFNKPQVMENLTNIGHSVKCDLGPGEVQVSGGGLQFEYSASQFHFHWGQDDLDHFPGSEHSIDGQRYPMEMHIVSVKKGVAQPTADPDGIAVLGFFIDVMKENVTSMPAAWNHFSKFIDNIPNKDDKVNISMLNISINDLLTGVDMTKYYRYNGSLTTPGCDEAVVWTVFQQPIRISKDLILRFAQKTGATDVYRPQQSLHSRYVYASAKLATATSLPSGHEWCYAGCEAGVSQWTHISGACAGSSQSPINIDSHSAKYKPELGHFSFSGFSNKHTMDYLVNNGHTVQAMLKNGMVEVGGGGLEHIYSTLQFHFHWGNSSEHGLGSQSQPHRSSSSGSAAASSSGSSSSDQGSTSSNSEGGSKSGGSEHTLDSRVYPMEMHIVSMRKDLKREDALKDKAGFAVLGFFIQETDDEDNPAIWKNFTDHLEMIQNIDSTIELHHDISLDALIGSVDRTKYYQYTGSLTTPSCNEAVIWTIFKEPIKVSRNLVKKFSAHTGLNNVFRSVQSLNSREVYTTVSSSPRTCHLSVLLILSALFTCLGINQTQ